MHKPKDKEYQQFPLNILYFSFYNSDNSNKHLVCYYDNMKYEIFMIENIWIMIGSSEDPEKHDLLKEIIVYGFQVKSVISKFFSSKMMLEIFSLKEESSKNLFCFYEIYAKFKLTNLNFSRFEKILPKHGQLAFDFLDQESSNFFIWQNKFCKIELIKVDRDWVASYTPKIAVFDRNINPTILANDYQKDVALKNLFKQIIKHLQLLNLRRISIKTERISIKRYKFLFVFQYENSSNFWIWKNKLCQIELIKNNSLWSAKYISNSRISDERLILITSEHQTKDDALKYLLKEISVTAIFGDSKLASTSVIKYFHKVETKWIKPTQQESVSSVSNPTEKHKHFSCRWQKYSDKCDGSGDCPHCASYSSAYFMRSDD